MDWATVIGTLAACMSVASFTPQAWRIIRTREVDGLSAPMYALTTLAFALWSAFGLIKGEWPIIVPNIICFLFALFILVLLLLPPRQRDQVTDALDPASD
jgi:MtN3 and saliva related transmembrane protein